MGQTAFDTFFRAATGHEPFDYQRRLAGGDGGRAAESLLVNVPTGLGKTAAVVLAWLWNSVVLAHPAKPAQPRWPRRLVYCLPMRTLVEQTRDNVAEWLARITFAADADDPRIKAAVNRLAEKARRRLCDDEGKLRQMQVTLSIARKDLLWLVEHSPVVLMGGEDLDPKKAEWDIYPERPAILIGTQDMLLSRALNRGYAMSRHRWPMHFGLLNNDCLWVMDEVQLMGPGLGTACQLEAFRKSLGSSVGDSDTESHRNATWYASATASRELLITRDWRPESGCNERPSAVKFVVQLVEADTKDPNGLLGRRRLAVKALDVRGEWHFEDGETPRRIVREHFDMLAGVGAAKDLPRRTLVICNTVRKARILFAALLDELTEDSDPPELLLLHSRFRREDRKAIFRRVEKPRVDSRGQIIVATQVIEAGVDISSAAIWTEAAPLPSVVQRLGRLNRGGEFGHDGVLTTEWKPKAFVVGVGIEVPPDGKKEKAEDTKKREDKNVKRYLPYGSTDCEASLAVLADVPDAGPASLETALAKALAAALKPPAGVLQRHELFDFFDTEANLSLGYTDVTPFVRGLDPDTDVQVLWRDWEPDAPPFGGDIGAGELCAVPLWDVKQLPKWQGGFIWQGRERGWQPAREQNVFAGAVLLLPTSAGGYSSARGWTGDGNDTVITDLYEPPELPSDGDLLSLLGNEWASISRHTQEAKDVLKSVLESTSIDPDICAAMLEAMDWHDFGKNHLEWQAAVVSAAGQAGVAVPTGLAPFAKFTLAMSPALVGKSGRELRKAVYSLKHTFHPRLRHEVASAIALRQYHRGLGRAPSVMDLLAEYIVISHHGHVRKVLRDELPKSPEPGGVRHEEVRGIVDGVQIGEVTVGDRTLTAGPLSIECRKMGRSQDGSEGWTKGVLRLLNDLGPFRIAYYEALFRAADWRASSKSSGGTTHARP